MDYCFCILCNFLWTTAIVFCVMFYGLLLLYFVQYSMGYCLSILCNVLLGTIVLVFCAMFYGLLL